MKKRIAYVSVHMILLLLALSNMYCVIKGTDYFKYIYMIDDVLRAGRGINTFIIAILCDIILFFIDAGVLLILGLSTVKALIKKEPLVYLKEMRFWIIVMVIAVVTFYLFFYYYLAHL